MKRVIADQSDYLTSSTQHESRGLPTADDAPQPPFEWSISLPPTWRVLDLRPELTEDSARKLLSDHLFEEAEFEENDKRQLTRHLVEIAEEARSQGALLALVFPGAYDSRLELIPLFLSWFNTAPHQAELLSWKKQLSDLGSTSIEPSAHGERYVLSTSEFTEPSPLGDQKLYGHQAFIPIPGSTWTLSVTSATRISQMSDSVLDVVKQVASSTKGFPELASEKSTSNRAHEERHRTPQNQLDTGSVRWTIGEDQQ